MKAIINGIEVHGTPQEIAEVIRILEAGKAANKDESPSVPAIDPHPSPWWGILSWVPSNETCKTSTLTGTDITWTWLDGTNGTNTVGVPQ